MFDPGHPSLPTYHDREIGDGGDKPTAALSESANSSATVASVGNDTGKNERRSAENSRRLSSLRQTIKRWDTRAKAKGYDTIVEALDAAPFKTPPTTT